MEKSTLSEMERILKKNSYLENYIEKAESKNSEILEFIREEISTAYDLSEKATDLNNKMSALWLTNGFYELDHSKMIDYQCNQLQTLWSLSGILYGLLLDFENNFSLIKYRKKERR